ncbi:bacteriocin-protection protein [Lysobacter sp. TY2-98]|uniref:YdeI/OmpD-associated family protein n=1 Tax=Lysobacter sp. TY2-98 TaxID=2290922 RepID=UPI000E20216A|nr:YdeI/OmpD-associated family protein [Lysobacter sp. TY2-98]AXK72228.1 bacteriocin-protection protein [Lysobacter sp. TY2-98]
MTSMPDDLPIHAFVDAPAFERWIEAAGESKGLWLRIAKAASGIATVTYDEALDVALCHGWIDGQKRALDADWFLQRFAPRRARSLWSRRNVDKVAALTAAGRMRPAGQREVDAAKADGRWDRAYSGPSSRTVPDELAEALADSPAAKRVFDALSSANRYAFCWRVQTAKRAETRKAKARQFVEMMLRGETLH